MPKYTVDGSFFVQQLSGIQRYAREILAAMDPMLEPGELEVAVPPDCIVPEYRNIKVVTLPQSSGILGWQRVYGRYLAQSGRCWLGMCNVIPMFHRGNEGIAVVHDVCYKARPDFYTDLRGRTSAVWHCMQYAAIAKKARKIVTVSEFSKSEIVKYYHVNPEKITVVYNAWQHMQRVRPDPMLFGEYSKWPQLKKGEILGVAGLVGAQRTELMEGIFGLRAHTSGKVWIKGEEVNIKQPRDAIQKSVALLTEDRRATGIMGVLSVADNISIASLDALRKGPIMLDNKKILDLVATNKEKMAIKVPSPKTQIKSLSGGNQQKVLIARWLANNPDVLILDEPTRGIDVGAKYEIYCIIADLAKQGKSIIMISSEMSEIIGMSNRVMVMCDGRITGFINGKDATQENIMALATQFETAPDAAAANQ